MGKIKDADAVGEVGNLNCGDVMKIYLKVEKNKIKDVKVETFGCIAAIVTSSLLTEMAKGKTLDEAYKITNKDISEGLELPNIKLHCSVLAASALRKAIDDYRKKFKV